MKVKKVMLGETSATEYTYDNGEVWTVVDNPMYDNLPKQTSDLMETKWVMFDFATGETSSFDEYAKAVQEISINNLVEKIEAIPVFPPEGWKEIGKIDAEGTTALKKMWKPTTRFGIPYFNGLESFLEDYGFKPTKLPWRFEGDRYSIIQLEDSDGNEEVNPTIYKITITSDDETVYRGRLFDSTHAAYIFGMVAEHRLLTGKDDFPKLPIEPVKFEINRTSIWSQDERKSEDFPGTNLEELPERYGNVLAPTRYTNTKEFTIVQEMLEYLKEVKFPLIIDTYSIGDTIFPVLEIYDDYRE